MTYLLFTICLEASLSCYIFWYFYALMNMFHCTTSSMPDVDFSHCIILSSSCFSTVGSHYICNIKMIAVMKQNHKLISLPRKSYPYSQNVIQINQLIYF